MADKLEAVIVCDGYGDFLEHTLPYTKSVVDYTVVVSSEEDKYTQKVCKSLDVECVIGYAHKYDSKFDKARAINHGLSHLELKDWWMHLDADIMLPPGYKRWFNESKLDKKKIYGADRFNCNYSQYEQLKKTDWFNHTRQWGYIIVPPSDLQIVPPLTMGARVAHGNYHGWVPIGHNTLVHSSEISRYPNKNNAGAEHTDLLFASHFKPENRVLIPDLFVIHLTTDQRMGANWEGRTSPKFGKNPELVPNQGYQVK